MKAGLYRIYSPIASSSASRARSLAISWSRSDAFDALDAEALERLLGKVFG